MDLTRIYQELFSLLSISYDFFRRPDSNYQKLIREMRRRGVKVLTVDWEEFGPPVEMWKKIRSMVSSEDTWFEQLTFSFNKHPRIPLMPGEEDKA